jgi:hypothetical protein
VGVVVVMFTIVGQLWDCEGDCVVAVLVAGSEGFVGVVGSGVAVVLMSLVTITVADGREGWAR